MFTEVFLVGRFFCFSSALKFANLGASRPVLYHERPDTVGHFGELQRTDALHDHARFIGGKH
jgi:hypothetical protein